MWTIINFIKRFVYDLAHAVMFSALEYDAKIQMTKTPRQRIVIWTVITILVLILLYILLYGLWYFIDTLDTNRIEI